MFMLKTLIVVFFSIALPLIECRPQSDQLTFVPEISDFVSDIKATQHESTIIPTSESTGVKLNETDVEYDKYRGYISTKIYRPLCEHRDCNSEKIRTTELSTFEVTSEVSNLEFSNPLKNIFGKTDTTTLKSTVHEISKDDLNTFLTALDESIKNETQKILPQTKIQRKSVLYSVQSTNDRNEEREDTINDRNEKYNQLEKKVSELAKTVPFYAEDRLLSE